MAYYVKVKPEVRNRILPSYIKGTQCADGNILLFQSDLNGIKGLTLSDRAAAIGGALLTPIEAKREIDGTCADFARCYDPEAVVEEEETVEENTEETSKETESTSETSTEETSDENTESAEDTAEESEEENTEVVENTTEETTADENKETDTEESEVNNG